MSEWWTQTANVAALLEWMQDRGAASRPQNEDNFLYFLRKPQRWQPVWDAMRAEAAQSFAMKDGAP